MGFMRYFWYILVFFFSACQSAKPSSSLRINIEDDPSTLDPRKVRTLTEHALARVIGEGLSRLDPSGKLVMGLAEKVEVDAAGLEYVFTLKDAYWSNRDPIVASDFVSSWKEAISPSFPSQNVESLFCIKNARAIYQGKLADDTLGVYARGDKTLVVQLEYPVPYFLQLLSLPLFFPVHSQEKGFSPTVIASGPFYIKKWKSHDLLVVEKNPHYYDAKNVRMESIRFIMVPAETELQMFQKGELDWAGSPLSSLPKDLLQELQQQPEYGSFPFAGTAFLGCNTENEALGNSKIRKALGLALDRRALVDHVLHKGGAPARGFLPFSSREHFAEDLLVARKLWQEGCEELRYIPSLTLLYSSSVQSTHVLVQALQQQWKAGLGVQIALESCESKVYLDRMQKLDFQLAMRSWIADYDDPSSFLDIFKQKRNSANRTGWENGRYTSLLEQASITMSEKERIALLEDCERILMEEMPILPLYYLQGMYLKNPRLQGVVISPCGSLDLKWAYWEE